MLAGRAAAVLVLAVVVLADGGHGVAADDALVEVVVRVDVAAPVDVLACHAVGAVVAVLAGCVLCNGVMGIGIGSNGSDPPLPGAGLAGLAGSNGRPPAVGVEVGEGDPVVPDGVVVVPIAVGLASVAVAVAGMPGAGVRPRRSVGPVLGWSSRGTSVMTGIGAVEGPRLVVVTGSSWPEPVLVPFDPVPPSAFGAGSARGGVD